MKLEFNSVGELSEFLEFSRALGAATTSSARTIVQDPQEMETDVAAVRALADGTEWAQAAAELEAAQGNAPAPTGQPDSAPNSAPLTDEAPKRKRRTKAEMEAARANEAAASTIAPVGPSETTASDAQSPATPANPFEASNESSVSTATQAILNAPSDRAATLAGIAAMQTQSPFEPAPEASAVTATPEAVVVGDAATFIESRSLELLTTGEPIKTVEHMHKCRDFIAKLGQAKYLESFPLAGLSATIGTFKPEQCARHQAALEFLSANA